MAGAEIELGFLLQGTAVVSQLANLALYKTNNFALYSTDNAM